MNMLMFLRGQVARYGFKMPVYQTQPKFPYLKLIPFIIETWFRDEKMIFMCRKIVKPHDKKSKISVEFRGDCIKLKPLPVVSHLWHDNRNFLHRSYDTWEVTRSCRNRISIKCKHHVSFEYHYLLTKHLVR